MDITFTCQHCQQPLVIDAEGAGVSVACPSCGGVLTVPPGCADVVIDASSAIRQVAADVESRVFDDDRKLDAYWKDQKPDVLAAVHGETAARAFLEGEISGRELRSSGFVLSPEAITRLAPKMETI